MSDARFHTPQFITSLVFLLLVSALLIGAHVGASFAGGPGYQSPLTVTTIEADGSVNEVRNDKTMPLSDHPVRGSVIETGAQARALIDIDGTVLALSENTSVELKTLATDRLVLFVSKGRVAVSSPNDRVVHITSNEVDSWFLGGVMTFVNYDFQRRVSVIPLAATVCVRIHNGPTLMATQPMDISEMDPFNWHPGTFSTTGTVANGFYNWFGAALIKAQTKNGTPG